MTIENTARKATSIKEVDQATRFTEPIGPDHAFYVEFQHVRGDFEERIVYRRLNVAQENGGFQFDPATSSSQKVLFFLGGMRGSGKTSELAKYARNLHRPECFFCVTCNIDDELDMNDIEYTDILIFQLEKLIAALKERELNVSDRVVTAMKTWFGEREKEINSTIKAETGMEFGYGIVQGNILQSLFGIVANIRAGLSASKAWVNTVRTTLKNKFPDFALLFNQFIEEVNIALRKNNLGKEVLFIVDGLEKTMTADLRKKIIIDESNRLRAIKAYTIFTLPIELMRERQRLQQFSIVETFPFVKLTDRAGHDIPAALETFREFVYRRIARELFESDAIVDEMIRLSGGSPRELLRILGTTALYYDASNAILNSKAFETARDRLASQAAQYINKEEWVKLKEIKQAIDLQTEVQFDDVLEDLLEKGHVMEYNDGSDKRPSPILTHSKLYNQVVLH
jgi:hypothetical protein